MKKIIARQLDGEYFNADRYVDEDTLEEDGVWIGGNRSYTEMNKSLITEARDFLEDCEYSTSSRWNDFNNKDEKIAVVEAYTGIDDPETLKKLFDLVEEFRYNGYGTSEMYDLYCRVLSLLKGVEYKTTLLRGYGQGDWVYCIHPKDTQEKYLDYLTAVYFGYGTEFEISDEPIEMDDYMTEDGFDVDAALKDAITYTHVAIGNSDDEIKEFISDAAGASKDDLAVFKIAQTRKIVVYDYSEII